MMTTTQAEFAAALHAATDRAFMHRKALRCASFRIGFWPDGMVISIGVGSAARGNEELRAGLAPRVIPWAEIATLSEQRMVDIIDELAAPVYAAIGVKAGVEDDSHLILLGYQGRQVTVAGYTADEFGVATVDISGASEHLSGPMLPEQADQLADHLKRAAARARGEAGT